MADNVKVLPSADTGAVNVATDDIGGIHYPWYKLGYGPEGSFTEVTKSLPMPVFLSRGDSPIHDAFGRVRISQPHSLFDSKMLYDNLPLIYDDQEISGGSTTSAHSTDTAMATLGVGAATAGNRVRQTFQRFNYQSGKSQLILTTGVFTLTGGGTGITQSIGLFDDNNGLFFQNDEGTIKIVQRSKTSGSVVDTKVAQADWNIDKMDGTGQSGVTIDFTKTQIFVIDFEWLGVGRVRYCLVLDGNILPVHGTENANTITVPYIGTPNLPVRYEIDNDGTGAASTMGQICSTVISEGGVQEQGILHNQSTSGTAVDMTVEDTLYAVVGIRLKSTHLSATVLIVKLAVTLQSASDDIEWVLIFNPTIAGPPSWINRTNSAIQYFLGATANTITNGFHIDNGYVSTGAGQSASGGVTEEGLNALHLGSTISGTPDTIALCARPINGSATGVLVEGGLTWRELS